MYKDEYLEIKRKYGKEKANQALNHNIERLQGNYEKLKFDDDRFDIILAIDAFYMINDMKKLLKKLMKSMKTHGKILAFYSSPGDINESKLYTAAKALKLNIELEKVEDDRLFWDESNTALSNLEEEFFAEGAGTLWKMKHNEVLQNLKLYEQQTPSRYFITISRS